MNSTPTLEDGAPALGSDGISAQAARKPDTSQRTSNPEGFGSHEQGQPDSPEEAREKPGHDGQPAPDKKDVEPGSDADADDEALGV